MRTRPLAVATAALFVLSVVGLATVDDDGSSTVVAAAASATERTGTAAYTLEQKTSISGNTNVLAATGQVDFVARRASAVMAPPPPQPATELVVDGTVVYARATGQYQALAQGKPWVVLPGGPLGRPALTAGITGTGDPLLALQALRRKGVLRSVVDEGADEVRGVRTTRYAGELDPARAFGDSGLRSLGVLDARFSVWISDDGLLRRQRMTTTIGMATSDIGRLTAEVTLELFDFGVPVRIAVPPPDQVHRIAGA